jgi:hypothetical protein
MCGMGCGRAKPASPRRDQVNLEQACVWVEPLKILLSIHTTIAADELPVATSSSTLRVRI